MIVSALKLVASAALLSIWPIWPFGSFNPRYGWPVAIGVCIAAAVVLHFVAP
jgi:hypothetical protein